MNIKFIEEKRNKPRFVHWYSGTTDYIDTYFEQNGQKHFLRGVAECAPDYEKEEIEPLKKRVLESNGRYCRFYGGLKKLHVLRSCSNSAIPNPLDYAKHVKAEGWHFQEPSLYCSDDYCDFHGNIKEFSGAFWYRIYDKQIAEQLKLLLPKKAIKQS